MKIVWVVLVARGLRMKRCLAPLLHFAAVVVVVAVSHHRLWTMKRRQHMRLSSRLLEAGLLLLPYDMQDAALVCV